MLISARYGIHGRNPRYALRICSSGRAAVTAAAPTKVRERGIGAEAARGNGRESDGGGTEGKKRNEADDTTRDGFRVVQHPSRRVRERFFRSRETMTGCHKCFQPGTLSSFITLGLQFFFPE
jgi:hypothetical protein